LAAVSQASDETARQVMESWQRGTLNTSSLRLAVRGNLNPKQLQGFKSSLISKVREVRSLRDRIFTRGEVTMDVDFTGSPGPLANRLKALNLPGFDVKLSDATSDTITLEVRATGG
ncbi:MAG TPA: hypothetical protein VM432_14605, partial [Bdellovibrionales bacterium]|nr:hypothetical protein [Bdellovibrionales bacterium]